MVKRPGTQFGYSGGGFILLQHILELEHGGEGIDSILLPFMQAQTELELEPEPEPQL